MPGFTIPLGYEYPLPADPTDVAAIQRLAEDIDASVQSTYDQLAAVQAPPACRVTGPAQVIANSTTTVLTLNSASYDNAGWTDFTASPQAIVAPAVTGAPPARYILQGACVFAFNATGLRRLELTINGTVMSRWESLAVATSPFPSSARVQLSWPLAQGDLVALQAFQASGGNLSVLSCELSAVQFDN